MFPRLKSAPLKKDHGLALLSFANLYSSNFLLKESGPGHRED